MKKLIPSILALLAVIGPAAALTIAFTDAQAQSRPSAARSNASGIRAHGPGASRAHVPRAHTPVRGSRSHAFHRGARVGVFVGAPIVASPWWHYPFPDYSGYGPHHYPPAVYVQEQPTVYIEQPAPSPALSASQAQPEPFWYYCEDSKTYYPYVQTCATPWQRVIPHATQ